MKKIYDDLDKLDEKLKKYGCFDLNREPCFAETSINSCKILIEKDCYECNFYKTQEQLDESNRKTQLRFEKIRRDV